jgi:hypothetical protein
MSPVELVGKLRIVGQLPMALRSLEINDANS